MNRLKEGLINIPITVKEQLVSFLVVHSRFKCEQIATFYKNVYKQLSLRPQNLNDFATYLEFYEQLKGGSFQIAEEAREANKLFLLMDRYKVNIPTKNLLLQEDVASIVSSYQQVFKESTIFLESQLPMMNSNLSLEMTSMDKQLLALSEELNQGPFVNAQESSKFILQLLSIVETKLSDFAARIEHYTSWKKLFKKKTYDFENFEIASKSYALRKDIWKLYDVWTDYYTQWMTTPFVQINTDQITETVTLLHKQVFDIEKRSKTDPVIKQIKQSVEQFKSLLPLLQELGNSFFKKRHWEKIFVFLGRPYVSSQIFTFSDLLTYGIARIRDQVSDISSSASGEYSLELQLNKIKIEWELLKFSLVVYSNDTSFIVSNIDAILNLLEDNQLQLQGMQVSRFISGIKEEVNQWVSMLSLVTETLEELVTCQRHWMNLECIFSQADLQKQLSEETNKFSRVDRIWKDFIRKIRRAPLVLENALNTSLLSVFIEANAICEEIQRGLETYLESKRKSFPRFYFLSNEDLLDVLSQTQRPQSVEPHLKKCFDNVSNLQFKMADISKSLLPEILGIIGADNEKLNFT